MWNLLDLKRVRWEGPAPLSPGKHTLEFDFQYDGLGFATPAFNDISGIGRGGTGVLKVDGAVAATQTMARTVPLILQWDETFDIGADTGTPVDDQDYQVPFLFNGKIDKLTISVEPRSRRRRTSSGSEMPMRRRRTGASRQCHVGLKSGIHVRRDKAALFQWVQAPPGDRSSRKRPEQAWRRRNV